MAGLLLIMAHPDDESMGTGGVVLRHARAGIDVHLICLTRGEAGWLDRPAGDPEGLARTRTTELFRAAQVLGIGAVETWDYPDGHLEEYSGSKLVARVADQIRRAAPSVVIGWGPDGAYGHPDHIAAGAITDAALLEIPASERPVLYHMALDRQNEAGYHAVIQAVGEDPNRWGIVAFDRVSVVFELSEDEIRQKVMAINCHESQIQEWRVLLRNEGDLQRRVYGRESYIRLPAREKEQILRTGAFPEFRQPTPPVV